MREGSRSARTNRFASRLGVFFLTFVLLGPVFWKNLVDTGWWDLGFLTILSLFAGGSWIVPVAVLKRTANSANEVLRRQPWIWGAVAFLCAYPLTLLHGAARGNLPSVAAAMETARSAVLIVFLVGAVRCLGGVRVFGWMAGGLVFFFVVNLLLNACGVTNELLAEQREWPSGMSAYEGVRLLRPLGLEIPRRPLPYGDAFSALGSVAGLAMVAAFVVARTTAGRFRWAWFLGGACVTWACLVLDRQGPMIAASCATGIALLPFRLQRQAPWLLVVALVGILPLAAWGGYLQDRHQAGTLSWEAYYRQSLSLRTVIWHWYLGHAWDPTILIGYGTYSHEAFHAAMVQDLGNSYNAHNQYLQSLLDGGVVVASVLIFALWHGLGRLRGVDEAGRRYLPVGIYLILLGCSEEFWGLNYPLTSTALVLLWVTAAVESRRTGPTGSGPAGFRTTRSNPEIRSSASE